MGADSVRYLCLYRDGPPQTESLAKLSIATTRCRDSTSSVLVLLLPRSSDQYRPRSTFRNRRPRYQRRGALVYCLWRIILIFLQLPSASPDFWTLTHQDEYNLSLNQWSNVQPFIHIIKLDRIQSRIHKTVFRVDKDVVRSLSAERAKLDQKMTQIRGDLDDWIGSFPQTPKNENKSTWMYDPESAFLDARDFYAV